MIVLVVIWSLMGQDVRSYTRTYETPAQCYMAMQSKEWPAYDGEWDLLTAGCRVDD